MGGPSCFDLPRRGLPFRSSHLTPNRKMQMGGPPVFCDPATNNLSSQSPPTNGGPFFSLLRIHHNPGAVAAEYMLLIFAEAQPKMVGGILMRYRFERKCIQKKTNFTNELHFRSTGSLRRMEPLVKIFVFNLKVLKIRQKIIKNDLRTKRKFG